MKKFVDNMFACDYYKTGHRQQYPYGTEYIYSIFVPRSNKYLPHADKVVVFGIQSFIKELNEYFNENFFNRDKEKVVNNYKRMIKYTLGSEPDTQHIEDLHDLGYLPIELKALPEGTLAPIKTPVLSVENTNPKFFWITNYLETIISNMIWQPMTSATIAYQYRKLLDEYALKTVGNTDGVGFQGHDFSMRGMGGFDSTMSSGAGHLLSFTGTDSIPAICYLENFYNANVETELVGGSVNATEHSVQCANAGESRDEYETFKRLITEVYPEGFVSIVSDTYDFWDNVGRVIPSLKEEILARNGKVIIRPDSGDPALIVTGDPNGKTEMERKGLIECLWDIFGGTVTEKGYKLLNEKIGAIYGDSITLERAKEIVDRLEKKGFASTNIVLGIGSYTYQYNTRDSLGFAMKATYSQVNGEEKLLYKDPATDDGTKRSPRGRVHVHMNNGEITFVDGLKRNTFVKTPDLLQTVFKDGQLLRDESLQEIRQRLLNN